MNESIEQFRTNIARVRNLEALVQVLGARTTDALDLSDILRAELVLAVSALDQFIHELVRLGMLDCYRGVRPVTPQFLTFNVSLESVLVNANSMDDDEWLDEEIRKRNGFRSFQNSERIAEAIRLISSAHLWNAVSNRLNRPASDIRDQLNLIVDRRNKIAHESDVSLSPYEELWAIDVATVQESVDFIELIAESIFHVVASQDPRVGHQ